MFHVKFPQRQMCMVLVDIQLCRICFEWTGNILHFRRWNWPVTNASEAGTDAEASTVKLLRILLSCGPSDVRKVLCKLKRQWCSVQTARVRYRRSGDAVEVTYTFARLKSEVISSSGLLEGLCFNALSLCYWSVMHLNCKICYINIILSYTRPDKRPIRRSSCRESPTRKAKAAVSSSK
jgi:hypothetical protein